MGDDLEQAEKRAYARGYQAGRKEFNNIRVVQAERRENKRAEGLFRQQVFCAALQGTITKGGWQTGNVAWKDSTDYVRGCKNIADEAVKQFRGEIVA